MSEPLILKFGGSVIHDPLSFVDIAKEIKRRKKTRQQIAVVVSAMRGVTDHLINLSRQIHSEPPKRELDMLVSVGERVSCALLAMALEKEGVYSVSFTGSQAGIITTNTHGEAKIVTIRPGRLLPHLVEGNVVIVAGFQGVSLQREITTLGRGGSDLSAVALAIALDGSVEFYKNVPGIYLSNSFSGEPIREITHENAIEIINKTGGQVLHVRAVELAKKNHLPLKVRSLDEERGTRIVTETGETRKRNYEASENETLINI